MSRSSNARDRSWSRAARCSWTCSRAASVPKPSSAPSAPRRYASSRKLSLPFRTVGADGSDFTSRAVSTNRFASKDASLMATTPSMLMVRSMASAEKFTPPSAGWSWKAMRGRPEASATARWYEAGISGSSGSPWYAEIGKTSRASAPARAVSAASRRACSLNEAASPATTRARPPTSSTTISSTRSRSSGNRCGPSPVSTFTATPRTPWPASQSTYLRRDSSSIDASLRIGVTIAAIKPFRSGRSMSSSFPAIVGPVLWRVPDGQPDPLRAHRHIDVADTEVGERVDHRVLDRGPCSDSPPLADALGPQWVPVGGGRQRDGDKRGEVRRARHRVCGEAGRQRVAQLVIDEGFEQRLGGALRNPPMDLSLDEHRVDAAPAIVHCDVTDQLRLPCLGVHLDDRDMHAERIGRILHLEVGLRLQPRLHTERERRRVRGGGRELAPGQRQPRGCADAEPPIEASHVALAHREQMGGEAPGVHQKGHPGPEHSRAAHLEVPPPHRPLAARDEQRVRVPDRDRVERDSQGVGHDLRPRGLVSLSLRAGPGQDGEHPLVVGLHRREFASPARDLHVAADADTELPRFPPTDARGLFLAQFGIPGRTKRDIKGMARVPAVVVGAGRGAVGKCLAGDEVAPPDLRGIDPELGRQHVYCALQQPRCLWPARAPVGAD